MKKTLSILLIVATVLLVLVSCNSEQNFTEDLVSVSLKSATSKALSATNDFNVNNVSTWKYTAKKVNGGLKTGETTEQVELIEKVRTNPLSQGVWDFELYGYNSENKQICYGKVSNVKITVSEHTVSIVVAPSQTAQGTIAIGEIKLVSDTAEYSGSEYTQTVAIYAGKTKSGEPLDSYTSVNSGAYYVEVTLTGASVGDVHTGNTVINVYDNLTTTVTGTIKETTQAAEMNKKAEKITASEVATVAVNTEGKNTDVVKIEVASTPTGVGETTTTTAEGTTTTEKKTSVSFPVGALQVASTGSETTSKSVSLEITSAPIETAAASQDYAITTSDGAVVAGFDFNLTGVESTTFTEAVTIETYIATGLGTKNDLAIAYVGTETGTAPTIDSYDTTTGKIVFKVYHFSKYAIISNNFVATDSNGKLYETFDAAIAASNNITLLKDVKLTGEILLNSSKTIDLNGKTLDIVSYNIELSANKDSAYKVTFKNGKIKGNREDNLSNSTANMFFVNTNGTLVLDCIDMDVAAYSGITLVQGANPANLEVKDSTINVTGGYGIGTNASKPESSYVSIQVDHSTIKVTNSYQDDTAIIVNVPATVLINDSTIIGERQGLILRGVDTEHQKKISNSTIESVGTQTSGYDYTSGTWLDGNRLPLAALVIGDNNTGSYPFGTKVELDNVTLKVGESSVRKGLFVYQDGEAYPVTVTGTINGDYTVNDDFNGALVFPQVMVGNTYYQTPSAAAEASKEGDTIVILDCSLSNDVPDNYDDYNWEVIHNNCSKADDSYWHEKSANFSAGYGTKVEPYMIATKDQFQKVSEMFDKYAYYKVSNSYTETELSDWKSVNLHGSFDGSNKHFTNVTSGLFDYVGKKNTSEEITLKNIEVTFASASNGIVYCIYNSGTTTFDNVKVHGTLENYWNFGSFFSYGFNNSFTAKFINSTSDATLICIGSTVGGFVGHSYEGAGNTFTLIIDENSKFTGTIYSTNGQGHIYVGMTSNYGYTLNKENVVEKVVGYKDYNNVQKITEVKPELKESGYTIAVDSNASKIVYSIDAQLDGYESDNETKTANRSGITMVLTSVEKPEVTSDTVLLNKVNSATIKNGADNYGYTLSNGAMEIQVPGNYNYRSGTIRLTVTQYNSEGKIICTGTTDVFEITNSTEN